MYETIEFKGYELVLMLLLFLTINNTLIISLESFLKEYLKDIKKNKHYTDLEFIRYCLDNRIQFSYRIYFVSLYKSSDSKAVIFKDGFVLSNGTELEIDNFSYSEFIQLLEENAHIKGMFHEPKKD